MEIRSGRSNLHVRVLSLIFALSCTLGPALAAQGDESAAPRMPIQEFQKLLSANAIVVLDVRSHEAYLQGHIPGAISIPLQSIESHAEEFKKSTKPIVAYCS